MQKNMLRTIICVVAIVTGCVFSAYGQTLEFPATGTTAQADEYVLAVDKDAVTITPTTTVIFYTHTMVTLGNIESTIKDPFKERTLPNALIVPIPKGQTAAVGDVVLTWWQSGSGLQRAYVVNADNPGEPVVKYLDLDYDNPATNKDGVPIGQMDEQLKPDSFVKITEDFAPGTAIAIKDEEWNSYTHYQVINVVGGKIVALGFAGKMAILDKAKCLPVPVIPKVKAGEKAYVKSMSSFREVTITKVDIEIGRVFMEKEDVISFGDVMNPVQMAQDFLTRLGYDPGLVDGAMGQKTEAAIREFQKAMNLEEDGQPSLELVVALYGQFAPPATPEAEAAESQPEPAAEPVAVSQAPMVPGAPLSKSDLVQMIQTKGYHHPRDFSGSGLSGSIKGTFTPKYEAKMLADADVVVDHATGLMWKIPSDDMINGQSVQEHIDQINSQAYAGFSDWRLPTIEELASLLSSEMNSAGCYLEEVFSAVLWNCLSASPVKGDNEKVWGLDVYSGGVSDFYLDDEFTILLVRTP